MTASPEVEAAWARCEQDWDNQAHHDALFQLAAAQDAFPFIASKYKPRAGDPAADRALERIRKAAVAKMMATGSSRDEAERKPFRATVVALIFLMIAVFALLGYVATMRNKHQRSLPPPAPTNPAH